MGGEKDKSLEEMEHFVEKPPQQEEEVLQRTFRSQKWLVFLVSINFPSPSLKELVVGFYIYLFKKILKIPSHFGVENFRNEYITIIRYVGSNFLKVRIKI